MILTNARVILGDEVHDDLHVIVRNGKIAEVTSTWHAERDCIDLAGNYLAPGFIDLHVHGALGRDTMEGTADAFREICEFHATGGTTSLLLTTATAPLREITDVLRSIRESRRELPQIAGAHIEGPFLSKNKPGAQRVEWMCDPTPERVAALLEFSDVISRVTIAPEVAGAVAAIREFAQLRVSVSGGHSDAWDEDARAGFAAGMRHTTHTFNCMSSARKRGTERVAGLLEFALSEPEILTELIADGHHVSPTLMKMLYRAKRANGVCLVTDATAGAGMANGERFKLAGRDCVVENGACWLADGSALAGSAARMIDCVRTMVHEVGISLPEAIAMATANPARSIGMTNKGAIVAGADADFVVLSTDLQLRQTFIGGRRVFG